MTKDPLKNGSITATKGGGETAQRIEREKVTAKRLYAGDGVHLFEN